MLFCTWQPIQYLNIYCNYILQNFQCLGSCPFTLSSKSGLKVPVVTRNCYFCDSIKCNIMAQNIMQLDRCSFLPFCDSTFAFINYCFVHYKAFAQLLPVLLVVLLVAPCWDALSYRPVVWL